MIPLTEKEIEKITLPETNVFLQYRGSIAHGTHVPPEEDTGIDDVDFMGVVIAAKENYLGLKEWGSRGTKEIKVDRLDAVFYELRKFIGLLLQGNPNVLGMLWTPKPLEISGSWQGDCLRLQRDIFVGKHVYNAFAGYAHAQLKKMFSAELGTGYLGAKRKALVDRFGFDAKNAQHLIRLLRQAVEFLETGALVVQRPDAEELIAIKRGQVPLPEIRRMAEDLFDKAKIARDKSPLPEEPNYDKAQEILVSLLEQTLFRKPMHKFGNKLV